MSTVRAVVRFQRKSAIPQDQVQMNFHFRTASGVSPTATELTNINTDIQNFFFATASGATNLVSNYMASAIRRTGTHPVDYYELPVSPGPMGVPIASKTITPSGGPSGTDMFAETAMCASFHGAYDAVAEHGSGGTRPKSTWRNRIYIGPLTTAATAVDGTTGEVTIGATARTDVTKAMLALAVASNGHNFNWCTWSPKMWQAHTVAGGWVDDAPDTQRRRGQAPILRTTFVWP